MVLNFWRARATSLSTAGERRSTPGLGAAARCGSVCGSLPPVWPSAPRSGPRSAVACGSGRRSVIRIPAGFATLGWSTSTSLARGSRWPTRPRSAPSCSSNSPHRRFGIRCGCLARSSGPKRCHREGPLAWAYGSTTRSPNRSSRSSTCFPRASYHADRCRPARRGRELSEPDEGSGIQRVTAVAQLKADHRPAALVSDCADF